MNGSVQVLYRQWYYLEFYTFSTLTKVSKKKFNIHEINIFDYDSPSNFSSQTHSVRTKSN